MKRPLDDQSRREQYSRFWASNGTCSTKRGLTVLLWFVLKVLLEWSLYMCQRRLCGLYATSWISRVTRFSIAITIWKLFYDLIGAGEEAFSLLCSIKIIFGMDAPFMDTRQFLYCEVKFLTFPSLKSSLCKIIFILFLLQQLHPSWVIFLF